MLCRSSALGLLPLLAVALDGSGGPQYLSAQPRILLYENFLSDELCDYLVDRAEPHLVPSTVGSEVMNREARRSAVHTLSAERATPQVRALKAQVFAATTIPTEHYEQLQVQRYRSPRPGDVSEFYIPHLDSDDREAAHQGGRRLATMILFLSDVEQGGETFFALARNDTFARAQELTHMDQHEATAHSEALYYGQVDGRPPLCAADEQHVLKIKPKKGSAVLFFSVQPGGRLDPMAVHGGCPVLRGTKYIAQQWIREHPLQEPTESRNTVAEFPLFVMESCSHPAGAAANTDVATCMVDIVGGAQLVVATNGLAATQRERVVTEGMELAMCTQERWHGLSQFEVTGVLSFAALIIIAPGAVDAAIELSVEAGEQNHNYSLRATDAAISLHPPRVAQERWWPWGGAPDTQVLQSAWHRSEGGDGSGSVLVVMSLYRNGSARLQVGGEPYSTKGFFQVDQRTPGGSTQQVSLRQSTFCVRKSKDTAVHNLLIMNRELTAAEWEWVQVSGSGNLGRARAEYFVGGSSNDISTPYDTKVSRPTKKQKKTKKNDHDARKAETAEMSVTAEGADVTPKKADVTPKQADLVNKADALVVNAGDDKKQLRRALKVYQQALNLEPKLQGEMLGGVHRNRAYCYEQLGLMDKADRAAELAVEAVPDIFTRGGSD